MSAGLEIIDENALLIESKNDKSLGHCVFEKIDDDLRIVFPTDLWGGYLEQKEVEKLKKYLNKYF